MICIGDFSLKKVYVLNNACNCLDSMFGENIQYGVVSKGLPEFVFHLEGHPDTTEVDWIHMSSTPIDFAQYVISKHGISQYPERREHFAGTTI